MPKGPIFADTREPDYNANKLVELKFQVIRMLLLTGDYIWQSMLGLVVIERKTVEDLIASIIGGRAYDEFRRVIEMADVPILLVEGYMGEFEGKVKTSWDKGQTLKYPYDVVSNFILTWQMAGMYVVFSPRKQTTPHRIASLYDLTQKETHHSLAPKRARLLPILGPLTAKAEVLAGLPKVGVVKAPQLVSKGSLKQIFGWGVNRWKKEIGVKDGTMVHEFIGAIPKKENDEDTKG